MSPLAYRALSTLQEQSRTDTSLHMDSLTWVCLGNKTFTSLKDDEGVQAAMVQYMVRYIFSFVLQAGERRFLLTLRH